jgi:serine/threonine protein kinase
MLAAVEAGQQIQPTTQKAAVIPIDWHVKSGDALHALLSHKLRRDVALKVLPDSFRHDPERLARFRREARVLASLNHPNIGGSYGLEEADGEQALVLELIEGPTLAESRHEPTPASSWVDVAIQRGGVLTSATNSGGWRRSRVKR